MEGRAARPRARPGGLKPEARYIVFHCADALEKTLDGSGNYYESIDLDDAFHPQTILAYEMNGQVLPIPHGAPLRLRVERQLGYKMAKYVMRIEAVESFADIGGGNGGYWEDRGYEWYAGIRSDTCGAASNAKREIPSMRAINFYNQIPRVASGGGRFRLSVTPKSLEIVDRAVQPQAVDSTDPQALSRPCRSATQ